MRFIPLALTSVLALSLAACGDNTPTVEQAAEPAEAAEHQNAAAPAEAAANSARAELSPTEDSNVRGDLSFIATAQGVRLTGTVTGLEAASLRGFHIHEFGDCSAPDATSAGGHWNPQGHDHGRRSQGEFHAGDMDNLQIDETGNASVDILLEGLEIGTGSELDVVGRSVIVHRGTDDYVSQPTGDAGARAACGVIELQQD
jgi:superoxide dismutase, Cu-Zn family